MKYQLLIILFFSFSTLFSQSQFSKADMDEATRIYRLGDEAYGIKNLFMADSLYTAGIRLVPFYRGFLNRAATRFEMGNLKGYCTDLIAAHYLGSEGAMKIYKENCEEEIVECYTIDGELIKNNNYDYKIVKHLRVYDTIISFKKYIRKSGSKKDELVLSYSFNSKNDTTFGIGFDSIRKNKQRERYKAETLGAKDAIFKGGEESFFNYLNNNLVYPAKAKEDGRQGTVYVHYVIDEFGYIDDVEVLRGVRDDIDEEAVRVLLYMPQWIPGTKNGKPYRSAFTIPIRFILK